VLQVIAEVDQRLDSLALLEPQEFVLAAPHRHGVEAQNGPPPRSFRSSADRATHLGLAALAIAKSANADGVTPNELQSRSR